MKSKRVWKINTYFLTTNTPLTQQTKRHHTHDVQMTFQMLYERGICSVFTVTLTKINTLVAGFH